MLTRSLQVNCVQMYVQRLTDGQSSSLMKQTNPAAVIAVSYHQPLSNLLAYASLASLASSRCTKLLALVSGTSRQNATAHAEMSATKYAFQPNWRTKMDKGAPALAAPK
mmetsp:Transcript_19926/g.38010  ORF Transcript_19926/g.38010 Transcript_19926/m.38010 type:complete len:109 (+) Transcript_19926:386-712(+)